MHGSDRSNDPNESRFLEVEAPPRLVIQHVSQPHFVLTVVLAEHAEGTAVIWHQAFEDKTLAGKIRQIVEPANEQNLDRLGKILDS